MLVILVVIIILTILIITLMRMYLYLIDNNMIEHYDDKYINYNINDCAKLCKTTEHCYGFAYDGKVHSPSHLISYDHQNSKDRNAKGTCYISSAEISGVPTDSIYGHKYSNSHTVCNKLHPMDSATENLSDAEKKGNATFVCSKGITSDIPKRIYSIERKNAVDSPSFIHNRQLYNLFDTERLHPQYYHHHFDDFIRINEGQNINFLWDAEDAPPKIFFNKIRGKNDNIIHPKHNVEDYIVRPYTWPRTLHDAQQRNLLRDYAISRNKVKK